MQDLFGFDRQRLLAASSIKPEHFDEFQRLCITLVHGSAFQFVLAEIYSQPYSNVLIAQLASVLQQNQLESASLVLDESIMGIPELETHLIELRHTAGVIHILGSSTWFTPARWAELNLRRDTLAHECQAKLVFWLTPEQTRDCANNAIDLWAWRSGVYAFEETIDAPIQAAPQFSPAFSNQSQLDRARRIGQLRAWLASDPAPPIAMRGQLWNELATLLEDLGQLDEALHIRGKKELPFYEELDDERSRAITLGKIADILQKRGQLDGALHIYENEELPLYKKLGELRLYTVTLGKIADIWLAHGQLDKALQIREQEQLPIFKLLGDTRSSAVTLGKIADILLIRGQIDEALHINESEVLPIFKQLGDLRSHAITLCKIADIWLARGQIDKALHIFEKDTLPIFEQLGDVYSRAMTLSRMADILQTRGQLDTALHILEKNVLPIFEQLGNIHSHAITLGKIANIWQSRGQIDKALYVLEKKVLPIFEKLGDRREALISKTNIAMILIQRDGHCGERASRLLEQALATARKMNLPEVLMIKEIIKEHPPTKPRKLAKTKRKQ